MALEHSDPLPTGVYWVEIQDSNLANPVNLAGWNAWAKKHAPSVRVIRKERTITGTPLDWMRGQVMWTLFRVEKPVPRWPKSVNVGLPSVSVETATRKDVHQRPPEQSVREYWGVPEMKLPSAGAAVALGGLLLIWAMSRHS